MKGKGDKRKKKGEKKGKREKPSAPKYLSKPTASLWPYLVAMWMGLLPCFCVGEKKRNEKKEKIENKIEI